MLFLSAVSCGGGSGSPSRAPAAAGPVSASPSASARPSASKASTEAAVPTASASSGPTAEEAPAPSTARNGPPRPSRHPSDSSCRGAALEFDDIYVEECALANVPTWFEDPPIDLEISPQPQYASGYAGVVRVAFVNRSAREVDMFFEHRCLFEDARHLFDLEVTNAQGVSAMLELYRPAIGMIGALNVECPKPYIGAKVAAGGRVSIPIVFEVSAVEQMTPGLPPRALRTGSYSVEVTTPLVRHSFLKGKFRMNVKEI